MAMFLMTIGHNERFSVMKRRFQHSSQTIHVYFHEVLNAMMKFAKEIIVPITFDPNPDIPGRFKRKRRIFKGAVGALDGTLISVVIPIEKQTAYRGRGRGECYQNVLAVCDFNMIFTFVWAGWEGVTHDSRVLTETVAEPRNGFPWPPPGKYYLCDAAYTHTRGFMAPYPNVRYWLGDFRRRNPETKEEKFDHAHAQLRNVIERAFGVLKARFPILKRMAPFPFNVQRNVVIACFTIHNFIRKEGISYELFTQYDQPQVVPENTHDEDIQEDDGATVGVGPWWGNEDMAYMANVRNEIANRLMQI